MSPIPAPAPAPRTHTYFGLVLRQLRAPHPSYDGPICDGRLPSRPCEAGNHIRSTRTGSRGWPRRPLGATHCRTPISARTVSRATFWLRFEVNA
jgi:hypothetical protein